MRGRASHFWFGVFLLPILLVDAVLLAWRLLYRARHRHEPIPKARAQGRRRWWRRKLHTAAAVPAEDLNACAIRPCWHYPNCPKRRQLYNRGTGQGTGPRIISQRTRRTYASYISHSRRLAQLDR